MPSPSSVASGLPPAGPAPAPPVVAAGEELPQAFRSAMRRLASAVAVVTARGCDGPVGIAVTSITSLSMEPPAVLVCINQSATFHQCLEEGAAIAISILSRDQQEVSMAFGGNSIPREKRFEVGEWQADGDAAPALCDAQANLSCRIESVQPYGSHSIVIARVEGVRLCGEVAPLIYQNGAYL